jgi:hypothetical protein
VKCVLAAGAEALSVEKDINCYMPDGWVLLLLGDQELCKAVHVQQEQRASSVPEYACLQPHFIRVSCCCCAVQVYCAENSTAPGAATSAVLQCLHQHSIQQHSTRMSALLQMKQR